MKRILLALGVIVFVGALTAGATGAFFSDSETSNGNSFTAGAIDLKVDSTQHYDGLICTNGQWVLENPAVPSPRPDLIGQVCTGTWALKDLNPTLDKFFNFSDVKPGDIGENTISLHVDSNDAYACADITNIQNDENTLLAPEVNAGDTVDGPLGFGELGQNLDFLIWSDNGASTNAGNNIWDADETIGTHVTGAAVASSSFTLADATTGPIPGASTRFLGLAWCAGTFTAGGPGVTPVCNGTSMGNIAQTDSYKADIALRVVQSRNNAAFRCSVPN